MDEYSFRESYFRTSRRWWMVALCVFLGGAAGWAFHLLQPPVYEARAVITAQIDFTQTWELNELEQDQAMGAVIALFFSPRVLDQVASEAAAQGIRPVELAYEKNIFVERRRSNLALMVRDRDAQTAAGLANLWAEVSYQALVESYAHALRAQAIRQILYPYAGCPTPAPAGPGVCLPSPGEGQDLQKLEAELNNEVLASSAILPAMIFDLSRKAPVPKEPVALRADLLSLAGALIGFVFGVILASSWQGHTRPLAGKPGLETGDSRGGKDE